MAWDVTPNGVALNTFGLTNQHRVEGVGLLTHGLVWPCGAIWTDIAGTTTTSWAACSGVTATSWSAIPGTTQTTWTEYRPTGVEDCE